MLLEPIEAQHALERAFAHFVDVLEAHVIGDQRHHLVDLRIGESEAAEDLAGDSFAELDVAVEANAVGDAEGSRLADVVQQDAEGEFGRRRPQAFQHDQRMSPDIAFGMKLGRLLDAFHGGDFGENIAEQTGFIEQFKAAASSAFGEDADQFIAHTLRGYESDAGVQFPNRSHGGGLDLESETRGETDGAQHAEVIFVEAARGIADGANDSEAQVFETADIVDRRRFHVQGVEQKRVDGEVTAENVLSGVALEGDGGGGAPVVIGIIAEERSDFDAGDQDYAELRAHELGFGKDFEQLIGAGVGGDVVVFGVAV